MVLGNLKFCQIKEWKNQTINSIKYARITYVFSRKMTWSMILSLYKRIWVIKSSFSPIFYAVIGPLLSFWIFHKPMKDAHMNKYILILIYYSSCIKMVFVKEVTNNMSSWLWQEKPKVWETINSLVQLFWQFLLKNLTAYAKI